MTIEDAIKHCRDTALSNAGNAIAYLKVVTDELNQAAIEAKKNAPKREKTCYFERAKMKRDAARLAKKPRAPKDQTKGRSKKQGIE